MANVNLDLFNHYVKRYLGKKVFFVFYVSGFDKVSSKPFPNSLKIEEEVIIHEIAFSVDNEISFNQGDGEFLSFSDWEDCMYLERVEP